MLAAWAQAETVTLAVRHDHRKGSCAGSITVTAEGIEYREGPRDKPRKKPHRYAWTWADTQQAKLSAKELVVLTYEDRWLTLGADREMRFALTPGADLASAGAALRQALGRKFVAALQATGTTPLWTLPAKHLHGFPRHAGHTRTAQRQHQLPLLHSFAHLDLARPGKRLQRRPLRTHTHHFRALSHPLRRPPRLHLSTARTHHTRASRSTLAARHASLAHPQRIHNQGELIDENPDFCSSTVAGLMAAPQTFTGIITDDMCKMGHTAMNMGPDPECVRKCVREMGSKYALYGRRCTN